jgi:hypothetical protein
MAQASPLSRRMASLHSSRAASNAYKHLKALRWRTPYQSICDAGTKNPSIFKINPDQLIPGPHT